MKIMQAYAPTSTHSDKEVEAFYEDVSRAFNEDSTQFVFLFGDFNAKIGSRQDNVETAVGLYGVRSREMKGKVCCSISSWQTSFSP